MTTPANYKVLVDVDGTEELRAFQAAVRTTQNTLKQSGDGFRSFNKQMTNSTKGFAQNRQTLQNVGYQIQDIAVQISSGTSASRALSQQLPQLLSGFGTFGIVLATASSVLIPLAAAMLDFGKKAREVKDILPDIAAASRTLEQSEALLRAPRAATAAYEALLLNMREAARLQRTEAFDELYTGLIDRLASFQQQLSLSAQIGANAPALDFYNLDNLTEAEFLMKQLLRLRDAQAGTEAEVLSQVTEALQLRGLMTTEVKLLIDNLRVQLGVTEQIDSAVKKTTDEQTELTKEALRTSDAMRAIADQITTLSSSLGSVTLQNTGLRAEIAALQNGATAAVAGVEADLARKRAELSDALGSSDGAIRTAAQAQLAAYEAERRQNEVLIGQRKELTDALNPRRGSSGSDELDKLREKYQRLLDPLTDYKQQLKEIDALAKSGLFNTEQIDILRQTIEDTSGPLADLKQTVESAATSAFTNFFEDIVTGSANAKDAFQSFAQSVLSAILQLQAQSIATSIFSAIGIPTLATAAAPAPAPSVSPLRAISAPRSTMPRVAMPSRPLSAGGRGAVVFEPVIVNNATGLVDVTAGTSPQGQLEVIIDSRMSQNFGSGKMDKVMANNYGVKRRSF